MSFSLIAPAPSQSHSRFYFPLLVFALFKNVGWWKANYFLWKKPTGRAVCFFQQLPLLTGRAGGLNNFLQPRKNCQCWYLSCTGGSLCLKGRVVRVPSHSQTPGFPFPCPASPQPQPPGIGAARVSRNTWPVMLPVPSTDREGIVASSQHSLASPRGWAALECGIFRSRINQFLLQRFFFFFFYKQTGFTNYIYRQKDLQALSSWGVAFWS